MENYKPGKAFWPIRHLYRRHPTVLATRNWLATQWNMDFIVVLVGNAVLFLRRPFFFFVFQSFTNNNVQLFLRMMYPACW